MKKIHGISICLKMEGGFDIFLPTLDIFHMYYVHMRARTFVSA